MSGHYKKIEITLPAICEAISYVLDHYKKECNVVKAEFCYRVLEKLGYGGIDDY